jgi:hypothetical protein
MESPDYAFSENGQLLWDCRKRSPVGEDVSLDQGAMTEDQRKTLWSALACAAIIALLSLPSSPFSKVGLSTALSRRPMSERTNSSLGRNQRPASGVRAARSGPLPSERRSASISLIGLSSAFESLEVRGRVQGLGGAI